MLRTVTVLVLLLLAACSKPAGTEQYSEKAPAPSATAAAERNSTAAPNGAAASSNENPSLNPTVPLLAYTYQFGIEAPGPRIRELLDRHQQACAQAGPSVCEVVGTTLDETNGDQASGTLNLKASPDWVARFKRSLSNDLGEYGGRLSNTQVSSEDLSVQIVDVDAHIKAQTALRDRLQSALQYRPGKTSDFVEASTALAKAQGDLDAMQSGLALLRKRVAMSDVTINYSASATFSSKGTFAPLSEAAHGFVGFVVTALAAIVTIIGFLLPFIVLGGATFWVIRWIRRRRKSSPKISLKTGPNP